MVLPSTLLSTAKNEPILVELKNGETYSGTLLNNDGFMNLHLTATVCTSANGERFWKMPVCYIRGSSVKYIRFNQEAVNKAKAVTASRRTRGSGSAPIAPGAGPGTGRGASMASTRGRGGNTSSRGRGRGRGESRSAAAE